VGSYAIGQGTITNANNSNYDITYVSGDFSIAKRSIIVTADAQSRLQGMPNPPLTYTIGGLGLVGSDTLAGALSTDATTSSAPGTYAIEQGSLGASANYELTYVGANLVVSPSNAVPTADAASTVEYNYEIHGGGRPAPVFFTGRPSSGDMQTIIEDPRLDGPVICKGTEVAAACVVASAQ
jgi:MBG domain (YGX type)